ncbi:MAG: PaaX family transcriptional regulator C-terminal domain-containing protein, partial [Gemmatimonadales bacterium]
SSVNHAHRIRSLLRRAPAGELLYSCLAFHGPGQGGELPGSWLVSALESAGSTRPAVRQTLFRLEREGQLSSRRTGRSKWYRLTATGEAQVSAGRDRLWPAAPKRWDGRWTIVSAAFAAGERHARLRLLSVLTARGYGHAGPGLHLHPYDEPGAVARLVTDLGLDHAVELFRAERAGAEDDRAFVQRAFPLRQIGLDYRRFLRDFLPFAQRTPVDGATAFALRLATARRYLDAAWDDPGLPARLLPPDWPADKARQLAHQLYRRCAGPAHRFGAALALQAGVPWREEA